MGRKARLRARRNTSKINNNLRVDYTKNSKITDFLNYYVPPDQEMLVQALKLEQRFRGNNSHPKLDKVNGYKTTEGEPCFLGQWNIYFWYKVQWYESIPFFTVYCVNEPPEKGINDLLDFIIKDYDFVLKTAHPGVSYAAYLHQILVYKE